MFRIAQCGNPLTRGFLRRAIKKLVNIITLIDDEKKDWKIKIIQSIIAWTTYQS